MAISHFSHFPPLILCLFRFVLFSLLFLCLNPFGPGIFHCLVSFYLNSCFITKMIAKKTKKYFKRIISSETTSKIDICARLYILSLCIAFLIFFFFDFCLFCFFSCVLIHYTVWHIIFLFNSSIFFPI